MIKVLIVDDQPLTRLGYSLVLCSAEDIAVVGEAGTGEAALELAAELGPDVVLMDVRMPRMNGIQATKSLTAQPRGPRVVVLTAFDLDEYAFGALDAGASAFLLKSATPEQLIHAVRTVQEGNAVVEPRITRQLIENYTNSDTRRRRSVVDPGELNVLSPREQDVFVAIAAGLTNTEICAQLHLMPATVKSHINHVFAKLGVRDRVQAVILAHRLGITSDGLSQLSSSP